MTENRPILYSYARSSCSWRVRIALAMKGIEYEYRSILDEDDEEFKKVNPMGQVPALVLNGRTFVQSVSILEYLDETYPQNSLMPADSLGRAKVRELVEMVNSGIQPFSNLSTAMIHSSDEFEQIKWMSFWIAKGFTALEKTLAETAGVYCYGNEVTMVDLFLVPQVSNARRWKVDMTQFPIISRIDSTLSKLDAFQKAHFAKQPDCEEEFKEQ